MYYSIDGKLEKSNEKNNKKIKEDFINIPFFNSLQQQMQDKTTSNLVVDKD